MEKCLKCHKIGHFALQCFHKSVNNLEKTESDELYLGRPTINSVGLSKGRSLPKEWFVNNLINLFNLKLNRPNQTA